MLNLSEAEEIPNANSHIVQASPTPMDRINGKTAALPAAEHMYWMAYLLPITSGRLPGITSFSEKAGEELFSGKNNWQSQG
jgi:hypothetical protein